MKYKKLCLVVLCSVLTVTEVDASMKRLFDKGMSNFNSAGTLENKKGWSGGGGSFRAELVSPTIASLTLPTWDAGCGGIDFHGGSFSMINSDELNQALRGIMQGASSYAFSLALGSVCPSCKDLAMAIQKQMQKINDMARGACEGLVDAAASYIDNPIIDSAAVVESNKALKTTAKWITDNGISDDWSYAALNSKGESAEQIAQQAGNTFLGSVSHKFFVDANIDSWNFVLSDDIDLSQVMMSLLGSMDRSEPGGNNTAGNANTIETPRKFTLTLEEFFNGPKKENNGKITLWKCLNPTADKKIACVGDQLVPVKKDWEGIVDIMIGKYKLVLGEIKKQLVEHTDKPLAKSLAKLSISNDMQLFLTKTDYDVDSLSKILGTVASVAIIKQISWDLKTVGKEINQNPLISEDTKTQRDKFHLLVSTLELELLTYRETIYKDLAIDIQMLRVADLLKNSNKT
jgi:hypothetical protein